MDKTLLLILGVVGGGFVFLAVWLQGYSKKSLEKYKADFESGSAAQLQSMYMTMDPGQLMAYKTLCAAGLGGGLALLMFESPTPARIVVGLLLAMWAFFIPDRLLKRKYEARMKRFNEQLVDGLLILASALRSGMSFNQALDVLTREMEEPISIEFKQVIQDTRLGKSLDESLLEMSERLNLDDLRIMVTAVTIVRQSGGNLAEVFDNLALVIRERQRIQGKIDSLTSMGKLQALVVCVMPLFIGAAMFMIDRDLISEMWRGYIGLALLAVMFTLQLVGYKIILKICTIDI